MITNDISSQTPNTPAKQLSQQKVEKINSTALQNTDRADKDDRGNKTETNANHTSVVSDQPAKGSSGSEEKDFTD